MGLHLWILATEPAKRHKLMWIFPPHSFEDGLKLVKLRGESMQAAADVQPSSMVSVLKLDVEKVGGDVIFVE